MRISDHDLAVKHKKISEFLDDGHDVYYVIVFKDRENEMKDRIKEILLQRAEEFKDRATIGQIQFSSKDFRVLLKPIKGKVDDKERIDEKQGI
ncbi:MAG: translation initiation factor IF-3 C-terminal domain-containing protein [Richelia sp. RM2_1_2]|nr:translation initiation factor IF-3 C-terminal domain-containing protein [Richelia sp. RM2_1_2]